MLPIVVTEPHVIDDRQPYLLIGFIPGPKEETYGIVIVRGGQLRRVLLSELRVEWDTLDFPAGDDFVFSRQKGFTMAPDPA